MIKLFEIKPCGEIRRFQTQLSLGKDHADFIMQNNILKSYGRDNKGFGFYEYNAPFEIVTHIREMAYQPL
jgi:hypothetical protein